MTRYTAAQGHDREREVRVSADGRSGPGGARVVLPLPVLTSLLMAFLSEAQRGSCLEPNPVLLVLTVLHSELRRLLLIIHLIILIFESISFIVFVKVPRAHYKVAQAVSSKGQNSESGENAP